MIAPLFKKILRTIARAFLAIALYFSLLAITGVLFAGLFPWFYKQLDHRPLAVNYSPDIRFRIEYYAIPFLPFEPHYFIILGMMGCSDCPGYVRLVDNTNGDTLQEKYFEMRQNLDSVHWEENELVIWPFATWPLPRR